MSREREAWTQGVLGAAAARGSPRAPPANRSVRSGPAATPRLGYGQRSPQRSLRSPQRSRLQPQPTPRPLPQRPLPERPVLPSPTAPAPVPPTADLRASPRSRSPGASGSGLSASDPEYWNARTAQNHEHWEEAAVARSRLLLAGTPTLARTHSSRTAPRAISPSDAGLRAASPPSRSTSPAAATAAASVVTRRQPSPARTASATSSMSVSRDDARRAVEDAGLTVEEHSFGQVFDKLDTRRVGGISEGHLSRLIEFIRDSVVLTPRDSTARRTLSSYSPERERRSQSQQLLPQLPQRDEPQSQRAPQQAVALTLTPATPPATVKLTGPTIAHAPLPPSPVAVTSAVEQPPSPDAPRINALEDEVTRLRDELLRLQLQTAKEKTAQQQQERERLRIMHERHLEHERTDTAAAAAEQQRVADAVAAAAAEKTQAEHDQEAAQVAAAHKAEQERLMAEIENEKVKQKAVAERPLPLLAPAPAPAPAPMAPMAPVALPAARQTAPAPAPLPRHEPEPEPEHTALFTGREGELQQAFRKVDTDNSGEITRAELIVGLRDMDGLATILGLQRSQTAAALGDLLQLPDSITMKDSERQEFERVFQAMDKDGSTGIAERCARCANLACFCLTCLSGAAFWADVLG